MKKYQKTRRGNYVLGKKNEFWISYNPAPAFYGEPETALCFPGNDGLTTFWILKGDWRDEYARIVDKGLEACKKFYNSQEKEHRAPFSMKDI